MKAQARQLTKEEFANILKEKSDKKYSAEELEISYRGYLFLTGDGRAHDFVARTLEDGTRTCDLIKSDEWKRPDKGLTL